MDPWKPLRHIGWIAFALGILDLLQILRPYDALILDLPGMFATFVCSWALLRRKSIGLLATTTAGGVVVADALSSLVLVGPLFWSAVECRLNVPIDEVDGSAFSVAISRLLLYGFQIVFWPYAAARAMKDHEASGIPLAYAHHTRATVIASFFVCGWMSLVVQLWAKTVMFRLV